MPASIFFITGASGSGKTTLLELLAQRNSRADITYHSFDSVGIPSPEVMQRDFGGPERWQEHATHRWIELLLAVPGSVAVIEGSTRPQFVLAAFRRVQVVHGAVLLLDCAWDERRRRLSVDRAQPDLAHLHMACWAAYLRGQADALDIPVLDTTALCPDEACQALTARIEQFASPSEPR